MTSCPICKYKLEPDRRNGAKAGGKFFLNCPNCGEYLLTDIAFKDYVENGELNRREKLRPLFSFYIRKLDSPRLVTYDYLFEKENRTLPTLKEQANNLLRWLVENYPNGDDVNVGPSTHSAIIGSSSENGFREVVKYLEKKEFINAIDCSSHDSYGDAIINVTVSGHEYTEKLHQADQPRVETRIMDDKKIFVVHGHDNSLLTEVNLFLRKLNLEPVILHEQASRGRTIIEKIERHSNVKFAIVLLTGDDVGKKNDPDETLKPRARQNVILELGYFMGKLGRENIALLCCESIEMPSDYQGVVYTEYVHRNNWQSGLIKELREAGFDVDANKVI